MQIVTCQQCKKKFQVPPDFTGQQLQCPSCDSIIQVSESTTKKSPKTTNASVVSCPSCSGKFQIAQKPGKQTVVCPHCETPIVVEPGQKPIAQPGNSTKVKRREAKKTAGKDATPKGNQVKKTDPSKKDLFAPPKPKKKQKKEPSYKPLVTSKKETQDKDTPSESSNQSNQSKPEVKKDDTVVEASVVTPQKVDDGNSTTSASISSPVPASKFTPKPIDHLLPPKFKVHDPEQVASSLTGNEILLPDAEGGAKLVEKNVVHIDHKGEKVSLVVSTPEQRERRRLFQNAIVIGIGMLLLAATIWMLLT